MKAVANKYLQKLKVSTPFNFYVEGEVIGP